MPLTNLRVVDDEETIQSRARAAIESYHTREPAALPLISARKGRHLDVDKILARSLPSLTVDGLSQKEILP